jgi:hypothetical protein
MIVAGGTGLVLGRGCEWELANLIMVVEGGRGLLFRSSLKMEISEFDNGR